MEQIERQERHRPSRASLEPRRHRGRIRAPRRIDDHELPVENRRAGVDSHGQPDELAQVPGEVGAILVHDADNPSAGQLGRAHVDQRPSPAPPRLEQVLVRIEGLGEGPRQHRPEVGQARQDRLLGLEPERELVGHRRSMVAGHAPGPRGYTGPARPDPESPVPRPPTPADFYRLRIPTEPRLSPDGRFAIVALTTTAPLHDGYRTALWLVPTTAGEPRRLTLGIRNDHHPRFSPDGRTLAFLSDRRPIVEEEPDRPADASDREDGTPGPPAPAGRW